MDLVTNTGFVRPIDNNLINSLSSNAVISLMWEPWEIRKNEIDLEKIKEKGIKIFGTNESDYRLKTMNYLGYLVLYFLLDQKITPSNKILILGNKEFTNLLQRF